MDRCYYFSESKDEQASNMTEAADKCKSLHTGANLISIRTQADQDDIYGEPGFSPVVLKIKQYRSWS